MKRLAMTVATVMTVVWSSNGIAAQDGSLHGSLAFLQGGSQDVAEPTEPAPPPPTSESLESAAAVVASDELPDQVAAKPWELPQPEILTKLGIDMGGWIQQGITFNSLNPADRFNGPVATNDRSSEYQLNQAWMYFVRPTKTDGCGWDIGGRIDVVYGTDWRFGQCFGLETQIDDPNSFYGLVLPQFYLEVAVNDLTVKMGHFATLTSLELVPAPVNFFYSHTYIVSGYFDPLLVTGLQADYKLDDHWNLVAGFNRGWLEFEDPSNTMNFLGGVKATSDNKKSVLSVMVDAGKQIGFTGVNDRTSVITVFTHNFTDRFAYGSQYTAGIEEDGSVTRPGENASWYGTEQILTYKLNDKWAAGLRYEWIRDNDGARVAGVGTLMGTARGWGGLPGMAGAYNDLSLGLNYRPHPNFVFRPEVRWDWYDGLPNAAGQLPFGDYTEREQFLAAMDMVVTF